MNHQKFDLKTKNSNEKTNTFYIKQMVFQNKIKAFYNILTISSFTVACKKADSTMLSGTRTS